jgi:hypothetical protein
MFFSAGHFPSIEFVFKFFTPVPKVQSLDFSFARPA